MPRNKINQTGVINPLLIIIIVVICLAGVWYFFQKQNISENTKKDKDWMYKYCAQEVVKLPEPPFKYKSKEGPIKSGPMVWISQMFPKDTRFDHQSGCRMEYKYDEGEAYASLGVEHKFSIEYSNEFEKRVDELLTSKVDSSWKKISPLTKEKSGNPGYVYKGFPMVFTRENPDLGTVEYINVFFGGNVIYIKIEFYAK